MLKSIFTFSAWTLVSRLSGYVRDVCIAVFLGAGSLADAFFVAFKLPNVFRRLFGEGAMNAAFVPIFSGLLVSDGKKNACLFASSVFMLLTLFLVLFVTVMQITMPWVIYVLAPGFVDDKEQLELTIFLARITLPYLLCVSLVALLGGMLQSMNKFAATAIAPIFLNICLIVGVIFLAKFTQTPAHALAYSVCVAGVVQLIWLLIHVVRSDLMIYLRAPILSSDVKLMFRNMVPGIIGGGVTQINVWIDTIIATLLSSGAVSYLYYADRINQLPLALVGTAIGIVLLPRLSKYMQEGQKDEAHEAYEQALTITSFFILPSAVAIWVIADIAVAALFQYGAFTAYDTEQTAFALRAFACGLPAFALIKILAPCFFAVKDTSTPVKIAMVCVVVNVVLNLTLTQFLSHAGIALATSLSAWVNVSLLWWLAQKRELIAINQGMMRRCVLMLICAVCMGAVIYSLDTLMPFHLLAKLGALTVVGMVCYFASVALLRVISMADIKKALKR